MPCFHPLKGYRSKDRNPSGKRSIVFNKAQGLEDLPVELPCGQCIGCRLERSRQWAIRISHEASLYEDNCFLTLTYSDENLPPDGSLRVEDFQNFMKRLRKEFSDKKIRFFHCGEYGEKYGRPHYHACIFNLDFADKYLHRQRGDNDVYRSETLEKLWTSGNSEIGSLTFESAAYVARYITKKVTGPLAHLVYDEVDYSTGEVLRELKPEYVTMSRRPGIGRAWFEKFRSDVFPHDRCVVKGKQMKVPKAYNSYFDLESPLDYAKVRAQREIAASKHEENNTWDRLRVREEVQLYRCDRLMRSFESED